MVEKFVFNCTSVKLKKFLMDKGFEYFNVFINNDGWTTWSFAQTPGLSKALKEYTQNRKSKLK